MIGVHHNGAGAGAGVGGHMTLHIDTSILIPMFYIALTLVLEWGVIALQIDFYFFLGYHWMQKCILLSLSMCALELCFSSVSAIRYFVFMQILPKIIEIFRRWLIQISMCTYKDFDIKVRQKKSVETPFSTKMENKRKKNRQTNKQINKQQYKSHGITSSIVVCYRYHNVRLLCFLKRLKKWSNDKRVTKEKK